MKTFISSIMIAALTLSMAAFGQQTGTTKTPAAQSKQTAPTTPADFDKQYAQMQEQMKKMQEQMAKIQQTKDPKERQQLLQDHWASMQSGMTMMHGMMGTMGCCAAGGQPMGGHMMGGMMGGHMMMWNDYSKLTPEQLKQRQYMMDRWMPMQQMMMGHMMQHQQWMMHPQQPAAPPK